MRNKIDKLFVYLNSNLGCTYTLFKLNNIIYIKMGIYIKRGIYIKMGIYKKMGIYIKMFIYIYMYIY